MRMNSYEIVQLPTSGESKSVHKYFSLDQFSYFLHGYQTNLRSGAIATFVPEGTLSNNERVASQSSSLFVGIRKRNADFPIGKAGLPSLMTL